jgi:hypothetical protein
MELPCHGLDGAPPRASHQGPPRNTTTAPAAGSGPAGPARHRWLHLITVVEHEEVGEEGVRQRQRDVGEGDDGRDVEAEDRMVRHRPNLVPPPVKAAVAEAAVRVRHRPRSEQHAVEEEWPPVASEAGWGSSGPAPSARGGAAHTRTESRRHRRAGAKIDSKSTRLIDRERFLVSSTRGIFELYVLHVHIFAILSSLRFGLLLVSFKILFEGTS